MAAKRRNHLFWGEDLRKQTTPARDRSIRVIEGGMDDGAV